MISLDATHSLQVVLAAPKTTLDANGQVSWEDTPVAVGPPNNLLAVPGGADFNTNGTTVVTIVASPPAGWVRRVKSITLNNNDTGAITLSVLYAGSATFVTTGRAIFKGTRATLEQVTYEDGVGFQGFSVALARQ